MRTYVAQIIIPFLLFFTDPPIAYTAEDLPDLALQAVTKTHSEIIRESPHSWKISVGGDTPAANESIQIEVLEGISRNPSLRSSGCVDFSSFAAIVRDVTSPDMTEEQKARALWRFTMDNCYGGRWGTSSDGLEHLNVYGYGYCGTFAAVLEPLWWAAGLRARHLNIGNHAATEVYYDNDWHYLDAHRRCYFLEKNNRSIASLEDLNTDPELWTMKRGRRSSQKGRKKYYYMTMHPRGHGRSPVYSKNFTLEKDNVLTLTWQKNGKWCMARGDEGGDKPSPEPAIYANGALRFVRDFRKPNTCRESLVSSKNIDWQDFASGYLHPARAKEDAYLIYQVKVPYFIPAATVAGAFLRRHPEDFVGIDFSTDNGKQWTPIWRAAGVGMVRGEAPTSQTQEVTTRVPWKYSYLIRIRMRSEASPLNVGAYLLESAADLAYNPKSLPALKTGENTINFQDEPGPLRLVKVTYRWQENLPLRITKEFPLEGEEVTLSALVSNLGTSSAKRIPVVFYLGDPQRNGVEIGRDVVKRIRPGETAIARLKWKASRKFLPTGKNWRTNGASIFVSVDPDNSIKELDDSNNTFSRVVKVLHPPEVRIPSEGFIRFENKQENPDLITITATIRNFSNSRSYGFYLTDHAEATGVVVKFFDGKPNKKNQIGRDLIIDRLKPLASDNVSVDWDISKLKGVHRVHVQVFPGNNVIQALGARHPGEAITTIDLDAYRDCMDIGK